MSEKWVRASCRLTSCFAARDLGVGGGEEVRACVRVVCVCVCVCVCV